MKSIYFTVTQHHWTPGAVFLGDTQEQEAFAKWVANDFVRYVRYLINDNIYRKRYKPLSFSWKQYKVRHNLYLGFWKATGDLVYKLRTYQRNGVWFVGFPKLARNRKGILYNKIARYNEYGTIYIPPRPLFRAAEVHYRKDIKKIYNRYRRETGP